MLLATRQAQGFDNANLSIRPFFVATQDSDHEAVIRKISPEQNTSEVIWRLPTTTNKSAKQLLSQHEINIFEEDWLKAGTFPQQGFSDWENEPIRQDILNIWQLDDSHVLLLTSHWFRIMDTFVYSTGNYELAILDVDTHELKPIWSVEFHDLLTQKLDGDYSVNSLTVRQVVPNPTQVKIAIMLSPEPLSFCCPYIPTILIVDYAKSVPTVVYISEASHARWSPDGKQLAYINYKKSIPHVYDIETKQDTTLEVEPLDSISYMKPALSWIDQHTFLYTWRINTLSEAGNYNEWMIYDTQLNKQIRKVTEIPVNFEEFYSLNEMNQKTVFGLIGSNLYVLNVVDGSLNNLQMGVVDKIYYNSIFSNYLFLSRKEDSHNLDIIDAQLRRSTIDLAKLGILKDIPIIDISP